MRIVQAFYNILQICPMVLVHSCITSTKEQMVIYKIEYLMKHTYVENQ